MPYVASEAVSWLSIDEGSSGVNTGTISISYLANTSSTMRTGTVTVSATDAIGSPKNLRVIQTGVPVLSVSPIMWPTGPTSGTAVIAVSNKGAGGMLYTASESVNWLNIENGGEGTNPGLVTISCTNNPYAVARTGIVTVTAAEAIGSPAFLKVVQAGNNYLMGWGNELAGEATAPAGLSNVIAIAAGYRHNLALQSDGTVYGWGINYAGQATPPAGLSNVVAISAGYFHSLALKLDGKVVAWGTNEFFLNNVPAGLSNVVAITHGMRHCLALQTNGLVVAWGSNTHGQINVPSDLTTVVEIAAGMSFSLALKADGTIVSWGKYYNYLSQQYEPIYVPPELSNVVAISAGSSFCLALISDGTVAAWGDNYYGQINVPAGLSNVIAVSAGYFHSLALKSDGNLVAWGLNSYGETNVPVGLSNVVAIAAGTELCMTMYAAPNTPLYPPEELIPLEMLCITPIRGDDPEGTNTIYPFSLQWTSKLGKSYYVARSTNLIEGFFVIQSNISANVPINTYTDAVPPERTAAYSVGVE